MKPLISLPINEFVSIVLDNQRPGMKVAEIGVYDGSTTAAYIDIIKENNGYLYCIDTFQGNVLPKKFLQEHPEYYGNPHIFGSHNESLYDEFMDRFSKYSDMMTVLSGKSHDMIPLLPDDLDVCFLDADHSYDGVKNDISLATHKVKSGGILCGHDCDNFDYVNTFTQEELTFDTVNRLGYIVHGGVIQAVYEVFGIVPVSNTVWQVKL